MAVQIHGTNGIDKVQDSSIVDADVVSLTASKLTGALPAIDGSALTGISGGLSEADQWRLTTDINGSQDIITSNLERVDGTGQGTLGTGMTQSGGVFTFPSTGIWLVEFRFVGAGYTGSDTYINPYIDITINNGTNWTALSRAYTAVETASSYTSSYQNGLVDVTDTANVKVRFRVSSYAQSTWGSTDNCRTSMAFFKLGET